MKAFKPDRFAAWCASGRVVALVLMMVLAHAEPEDPEVYRDSVLHRTNQALVRAPPLLSHGSDGYETLSEYARKCDAAT